MPIRNQEQSRQRTTSPKTLSNAHLDQLLSLSAEHPGMRDLHDVLQIILGTGTRVGEMRALQWKDVDFPKQILSLTSKTCDVRRVPLDLDTLRVLEKRRGHQTESEYVLGTSPIVLLNRVSRKLATLSISIGVGRVSLHMLRSKFIARLVSSEADISRVMSICGFSWAGFLIRHPSWPVPKTDTSSHMQRNL